MGRGSQSRALDRLRPTPPIQERTPVLGEVMPDEILLIYIIYNIQEIMSFTFKRAVFNKIDQSNVFCGGLEIINLWCKLQFQIMKADSSKLGIIVQQTGREREYSNQSKTYCSHLLPLSNRGLSHTDKGSSCSAGKDCPIN